MSRLLRLFVACCWIGILISGEMPADATVVVTLGDGVAPRVPGQREGNDVELELTRIDGRWTEASAYAAWYSRGDHDVSLTAVAGDATAQHLVATLALKGDRSVQDGGQATYTIDLKADGGSWSGTFTGTFQGKAVTGPARATIHPRYTRPADGFHAPAAGEHPRLIFRKADLPDLKRRMETPEGKAIVARMRQQLARKMTGGNAPLRRLMSYPAADFAVAFQLTGEQAQADAARKHLEDEVLDKTPGRMTDKPLTGEADSWWGPYLLGTAIALDCCWDAWDPAFRTRVIAWVEEIMRVEISGMRDGKPLTFFNPLPWTATNAIRTASIALAAGCLRGESRADGTPVPGLDAILRRCARDTRRYFQLGLGASGWSMEGSFRKSLAFAAGPAHVVQTWRTCVGGDLLAGWPGDQVLIGDFMAAFGNGQPPNGFGSLHCGEGELSGLYPVGLATVRADQRAALRWLYEKRFGAQGDGTWGIFWPHHAAYVLMNFPFDVPARPPHDGLPWALTDVRKGYHLFRHGWGRGDAETLVDLCAGSEVMQGNAAERVKAIGHLRLAALGQIWVDGQAHPPLGPMIGFLGGRTTHLETTADTAAFTMQCDEMYFHWATKMNATEEELKEMKATLATYPRSAGVFVDGGTRLTRHYGLDVSGACGAPLLLVIGDRIAYEGEINWLLPLAKGLAGKVDGRTVTASDGKGGSLRATVITPEPTRLTEQMRASGPSGDWLVVVTIQKGAPPAITTSGSGLDSTLTIGGRTVRFDGTRFVFGGQGAVPSK